MKKDIVGKTLTGEEHLYEFEILSAKAGVRLAHQYGSLVSTAYPLIKDSLTKMIDGDEGNSADQVETPTNAEAVGQARDLRAAADLLTIIPQVFTWDRVENLAKRLMANGKIDDIELDEDGFCDLFQTDLLEFYTALFYAIVLNYPKYLLPFLEEGDSDSTQDS